MSNTRKALDSIPSIKNKINGHTYKSVANIGEEKTLVVITGTYVGRKNKLLPLQMLPDDVNLMFTRLTQDLGVF